MPESAFIVRVPEAEPHIGALRERFDATLKLGAPAHITVLVPFMSPELITASILDRVSAALRRVPAFAFQLDRVGRFPETAYLAPTPAEPFVALTQALANEFPDFPPFRGAFDSIIPHLTVANGNADEAKLAGKELAQVLRRSGPIPSYCQRVDLLENASGMWRYVHSVALGVPTS